MAISEKTILDPEASKPGIPLKKSTLAVLLVLLLVLGFVTSLVFSRESGLTNQSPAKDAGEIKQVGNNQVLKDEEAAAAGRTATAVVSALPTSLAMPPNTRRDDSVGALYDKKPSGAAQGRGPDLEREAAVRISKSVVEDYDDVRRNARSGNGTTLRQVSTASPEPALAAPPQVPSTAIGAELDRIKAQLLGAQDGQRSEQGWFKEYAEEAGKAAKTISGYRVGTSLILRQGKIIPAVLGRPINSDLPGRITAYVSSNVYDGVGQLVIPMGSVLVGRYDSGVKVGQNRLMFAFERLILPNGYSFDLPAASGSDLSGAAGMTGEVDNHFLRMFGSSLLIAFLADRTKPATSVTNINSSGPSTAAGQVLTDVSRSVLERNRSIPPTITIEQGTRINVEVVADMVFPESYRTRYEGSRTR